VLYIHKTSERSDQGDRINKYWTSWKWVEYWREINVGVKVTAACLGEFTIKGEKKLNDGSLFEMTLSLKSEKYRSGKNRVNECVLREYNYSF